MKSGKIYAFLQQEQKRRPYYIDLETLEQTANLIKVRLVIAAGLFVQIYRNERYHTTNLALIYNGNRLYAPEGQRAVNLTEFLDEVETILSKLDLP